jgi:hypothetical protein
MTLIQTIEKFIEQCEGDLEDLSWQIREETNFEDNSLDWLSEEWDAVAKHLENLKEIKSILENSK